jgi:hypothetical protein
MDDRRDGVLPNDTMDARGRNPAGASSGSPETLSVDSTLETESMRRSGDSDKTGDNAADLVGLPVSPGDVPFFTKPPASGVENLLAGGVDILRSVQVCKKRNSLRFFKLFSKSSKQI